MQKGIVVFLIMAFVFVVTDTRGAEEIMISADPELPAVNLVRNGDFELPHGSQKVFPTGWGKWPSLAPPKKAWRDVQNARLGLASAYVQNIPTGETQALVQRLIVDVTKPEAGKFVVLSFWGKTNGVIPGQIEVFNEKGATGRERIATKSFENNTWEKMSVRFKMPKERIAIFLQHVEALMSATQDSIYQEFQTLPKTTARRNHWLRESAPARSIHGHTTCYRQ